jgi:hypothetical protein
MKDYGEELKDVLEDDYEGDDIESSTFAAE